MQLELSRSAEIVAQAKNLCYEPVDFDLSKCPGFIYLTLGGLGRILVEEPAE